MKIKFYLLIAIVLINYSSLLAQDIKATEVRVTEDFVPSIPDAFKLNEQATFSDTTVVDKTQDYLTKDFFLNHQYKTRPLKAAKIKPESLSKLIRSEVRLGAGHGTSASIMHNSKRSRKLNYGISFEHYNNNNKIDNNLAGISDNHLHLYVKNINPNRIYIANLDYDRVGAFTYGKGTEEKEYDESITKNNPFYNRFAYSKFSISSISRNLDAQKPINKVVFFFSDLNEFSENQFHIGVDFYKSINGLPIDVEFTFDNYLNYYNDGVEFDKVNDKEITLSPSTQFKRFGIDFETGFDLEMEVGNGLSMRPQIRFTKELVKDILIINGGLRLTKDRNTIKSLSDDNPYIHSYGTNQSIDKDGFFMQNIEETEKKELFFAMQNVLGKDMVFNGSFGYAMINNLAHFVNLSNDNYNRFKIEYIESVRQLHINCNYSSRINNYMRLNFTFDYYKWDKDVYHKPDLLVNLLLPINLRNKIKLSPSLLYKGDRKVIDNVLPAQLYANLSLEYNYSKILSVYLELDNLLDTKKEFWKDYSEVGFYSVFGIAYSF
tara:strand:+ start:5359 stop:6999 length:1641 start_codon:yes stop_codon:yes gene_type:complete